jgi:prolyl oligopeptidase
MSLVLPLMLVALASAEPPPLPPPTPVRPVIELIHGRPITDPYRWLEQLDDPAVAVWAHAQSDYARSVLSSAASEASAESATGQPREVAIEASRVRRLPDGKILFLARMADDPVDSLYVRSPDGRLARAFSPSPSAAGRSRTIAFFVPNPDGSRVAIAMAENGNENNALHVLDVATGELVDGPIPGVRFEAISWWPDGRRFVYTRLREAEASNSGPAAYAGQQVYAHTVGSDWRDDRLVFGRALPSCADLPEGDFPEVEIHAEAGLAFGRHSAGVAQEFGLYVAPLASLDRPTTTWRRLFGTDAGYGRPRISGGAAFAVTRGRLYLTHLADRGAIHQIDLSAPGRPVVRVADPEGVILGLVPAADGLYVPIQNGMHQRLVRLERGDRPPVAVPLPFDGQFDLVEGDPRIDGVVLRSRSWTSPSRYWTFHRDHGEELVLAPVPADDIDLAAEEVEVTGADGTRIPLSIVHPADWKRGEPMPFLLTGYAAYGISMRPVFNDNLRSIYRDGIGYAVCHARGGGERGDVWHRAAMKATKHLAWEDFISCAEWLTDKRYTRPDRLIAEGASAGGLLVGRAMTERPDLFAGVHLAFGGLNPLRAESQANGAPNVAEFGSITDPDEARWILDMDTYQHVQPGIGYPAVLLTHGWNDARTPIWASAKTAARLQASSSSGRPVLMNIDFDGGHQILAGPPSTVQGTRAMIRAFFRFVLSTGRAREEVP